jgi:arylsulfatase A-like enzyme/tetratricopeptide (TPR) repeat protein
MPLPRLPRLAVLLPALILLFATGCNRVRAERPLARPAGPNVVLITIDTLRADHVGAYGAQSGATPTLDALAAEGTVFETVMAAAPLTLPSHASILTGRTPPHHGVRHNGLFRLGADTPTLAQRFREGGWDTGAVIGAVVLAPTYGLDRGFEFYDADVSPRRAALTGFHERRAADVTDVGLGWIGDRERPFFLWLHYYDPHAVYDPPAPFAERFRDDPYTGEIAYVDAELARLVRGLRVAGELERTLLVVSADHGESLGQHGEATHAYTVTDASLRVPWLLRGPGVAAGRRVAAVASGADLAPTLLGMVGLAPLPGADGRDLSAVVRGAAEPPADGRAYSETLATELDHGWAPLHAVRSDRHLYVRAPRPELYDVTRDPDQLHNLLAPGQRTPRDVLAPLERALDTALAREGEATHVALDAETRKQLQALGYALPEGPVAPSGMDPKDGLRLIVPFETAKAWYQEGRVDEAERLALEVREEMPDSPAVHDLLARIALSQNRADEALAHAERALALAPGSPHSHALLGLALVAKRDFAGAVAAFEEALEIDPSHANAQAGLMWRLEAGGSQRDAERAAQQAVALAPQSAEVRVLVADTWDQLGRYDLALDAYREGAALDPRSGQAHLGIAVQMARLGSLAEMDAHVALAGAAAGALGARMRLAVALAGRGEAGRAESLLRGLLADAPDFAPARRVLALLLERTGRGGEAAALRSQTGAS